jgi:hypothetical protein
MTALTREAEGVAEWSGGEEEPFKFQSPPQTMGPDNIGVRCLLCTFLQSLTTSLGDLGL